MQMNINQAGNRGKTLTNAPGDFIVSGIVSLNLDINGRGKPKVKNLGNDIGGLKEERKIGKLLLQPGSQFLYVLLAGTMMILVKRDQDFAVRAAYGRSIAKRVVERFRSETNVVDNQIELFCGNHFPDLFLNPAEDDLRAFDACSRECSYADGFGLNRPKGRSLYRRMAKARTRLP